MDNNKSPFSKKSNTLVNAVYWIGSYLVCGIYLYFSSFKIGFGLQLAGLTIAFIAFEFLLLIILYLLKLLDFKSTNITEMIFGLLIAIAVTAIISLSACANL